MSSAPGTRILNVVNDVIYVKLTGSFCKWDTHFFSVDIQSLGIKKVVLRLKDTGNSISLLPERKDTLEEEVLEQVEEASSKLQAAHAALWKAYEGTVGIQETFTKVTDASARLDSVRNKLSLLKDSNDALETQRVKAEDVEVKPDPAALEDTTALRFESASASPCRVLSCSSGNPNPDPAGSTKPWAYYVIPFDPIDIPTQCAKRKAAIDTSTDAKRAKLEI
ncbi:hypothetical protein EDD15DRAFT_2380796 [Pisolithus albus]|nr:hypothetical protein EDD15DRAFT_2380796 [Pisolithus albus]